MIGGKTNGRKNHTFESTILSLLENKRFSSLKDVFITMNPSELLRFLRNSPRSPAAPVSASAKELAAETSRSWNRIIRSF
jgi:hypothetical protein